MLTLSDTARETGLECNLERGFREQSLTRDQTNLERDIINHTNLDEGITFLEGKQYRIKSEGDVRWMQI